VTIENNRPETMQRWISQGGRSKFIHISRDPAGIISTRAGRKPVEGDYRSEIWQRLTVNDLIGSMEAAKIWASNKRARELAEAHPDRVLVVNFEQLILKTKECMADVAKFLDIKHDKSLSVFSFAGKEVLAPNGEPFVGKINDDPLKLLGKNERNMIDLSIGLRESGHRAILRDPLSALKYGILRGNHQLRKYRRILSMVKREAFAG
jgi:hypothetical protein